MSQAPYSDQEILNRCFDATNNCLVAFGYNPRPNAPVQYSTQYILNKVYDATNNCLCVTPNPRPNALVQYSEQYIWNRVFNKTGNYIDTDSNSDPSSLVENSDQAVLNKAFDSSTRMLATETNTKGVAPVTYTVNQILNIIFDSTNNILKIDAFGVSSLILWSDSSRNVKTDTSAHFASANKEYLTIPSNSSLQTGDIDFEIGGWVRFDSVGTLQTLSSKSGEYSLYMFTDSKIYFEIKSIKYVASSSALSANTWYFIRAWNTTADKTVHISINNAAATTDTITTYATVLIGAFNFSATGSGYLNGRLDSWYFQKRISTTAEATSLYNAGAGRTYNDLTSTNGLDTFKAGLTSWWDFNEEGGTRYDSKGSNHLTATADPIIQPPVYGSELVQNPGFETAGAGGADVWANWTEIAGDGAIANETTIVHSGSDAAKITIGTNSAYILQSFSVTAGASYYLSFWSRGDGVNEGFYGIYDVTNSAYLGSSSISTNNPTTTYKLFTTQFVAPAGCSSMSVYLRARIVAGAIAYFDDVSVKQIITPSINNGGFDLRPATGGEKTNLSPTYITVASNVETLEVADHGLKNGDIITVTGFLTTSYNATNKAVTVIDKDTISFVNPDAPDRTRIETTTSRIATDVFSGWDETFSSTSMVNAETSTPYTGSYAARFDINASNNGVTTNQSVVIAGKKYNYTITSKNNGSGGQMVVGGNTGASHTYFSLTTSYAQYTGTVTPANNVFSIIGIGASKSIYIDQVTLTSLGPTAEAGIAAGNAIDGNFAAGFNGSNVLNKASNADLQQIDADYTLFAWVNLNGAGNIMSKAGEYTLYYDATQTKFIFSPIGSSANWAINPTVVTFGSWYFLEAGYTKSTGRAFLSVNNGTQTQVVLSGTPVTTTNVFNVGLSLKGNIDGAGKLNRALTTDERTALYNNGKGLKYAQLPDSIKNDSALKGYWNLDEKSGTRYDSTSNDNDLTDNGTVTQVQGVNYYEGTVATVFDSSGNSNTFSQTTLSKRPTYCSICLNGKPAMLFDGVDDALFGAGDKIGTGDVTITAVINARSAGVITGRIIDTTSLFLFMYGDATKLGITSNAGTTIVYSGNSSIAVNTSYIVTVTRTSAGVVNIYIGNVLSGSADQNSGTPVAGSDTYIGNRAAGDRAFDGSIATVIINSSILTAAQRTSQYNYLKSKYGL